MTLFEIITITLSVILGLSMGHILWSTVALIRAREEVQLHWLPLSWAAGIFLQHSFYWFAAYSISLKIDDWTWAWYLQLLLLAILLFAAGAMILPTESKPVENLLQDFEKHGRLALIPLAAHQLLWFPTNFRANDAMSFPRDLLIPGNLVNIILILFIAIGFRTKSTTVHGIAVSVFLLVLIWAQSSLWSQDVL